MRVAQQAVFRDFARAIPEASPGRAGILLLIDANPGVTQSRLAQAVGIDRSTLVGVLHALEARELVERRRGEDRRTNGVVADAARDAPWSRASSSAFGCTSAASLPALTSGGAGAAPALAGKAGGIKKGAPKRPFSVAE